MTDSLFSFDAGKWRIESSSYTKLRLEYEVVVAMLITQGFRFKEAKSMGGLEYIVAVK